jgi:hypothetical protein
VRLVSSDSNVAAMPDSVIIPNGSYYQYFTIRGKTPGSVSVVATAAGYRPDTASVIVTSPRLVACCNYTFNAFGPGANITVYAADSVRNTHNRSSPLAVSIVSTDANVVTVDSATVTIPAGQSNNGNAHLTPVGTGTARIIFSAAGHPALDTLTITVNTPKLQFSFNQALLGRRQVTGQFDLYVYLPHNRTSPLDVTITQSNATADSLSSALLQIPSGTSYQYFSAAGRALGVDTLIATAPGYLPDTAIVRITTPRLLTFNLPGSIATTNPPLTGTVYAADSVNNIHYSLDTVVVGVTSSDSNVLRSVQPFVRILPGTQYVQHTINVMGAGTAAIVYADSAGSGYQPDTTNVVTVTGPSLALANGSPVLGMRQRGGVNSSYVYVPNNVASPLTVNLISTDTRVATVPASVVIPAGSYYQYFEVTAQDTIGTIQIQATATGYGGATMNVQVTQPKFLVYTSTSIYTTSPAQTITVYTADANGNSHPNTEDVVVTLVSSAPSVANVDSLTITIPSGQSYSQAATWTPGAFPGTAQITASDARAAYYRYNNGSVNVAVSVPYLSFGWSTRYLGIGQYDDYMYVATPDYQSAPLTVSFTHSGTARTATYANLSTTPITGVTILAGESYKYFRLAGTSAGTDTLIATATAPAHTPDSAYTIVGLGRVDPISGWPATLAVGDSALVTIYARDQNQGTHYVLAATTFTLTPNANIEFRSGGANSTVITQATIPTDGYYAQFYVKALSAGQGSISITNANYSTYNTTLTVP